MADADKILQALERLESGQRAIRHDIKDLQEGQNILELKVEAIGALQQKSSA